MFPSHLFPAHFPYPFSLSKAVTGARFLGNSSTLRYWRYFPSHFSLPTFSYTFSPLRLFPCPLFPTLVPCQKQSVAPDSPESPPLLSLHVSLPSFSLPTVPFPLSLFLIMSLPSFPVFDYFPANLLSLMILCYLYKLLQWQFMYEVFKWTEQPDYILRTNCIPPSGSYIHFSCKRVSNFGLVNFWKSPFN